MRILFLASFFPKPTNPLMGVWAMQQARALARQPGIELRVVSFSSWVPRIAGRLGEGARAYADCPPKWDWDGLEVEYPRWLLYTVGPLRRMAHKNPSPQLEVAWISARRQLRRIVREWKPDAIVAHHTLANGFMAQKIYREFKIPFVTIDWDFGEVNDCGRLPKRAQTFSRIAEKAECSIAVAQRMQASIEKLFPQAHTRTIHSGVEGVTPDMKNTPRPAELEGKTVVLSVGVFYERKGIPLLIDAFAQVAPKYPNAILRIAGDGAMRPQIEEAIKRHGLENRVELLGFQPYERILQEMAWADIFALIGWDEPFATVFMEAMSAQCPIICANDGGVNDLLRDGIHGRALPPRNKDAAADALDQLLSNPDDRNRMGQAAGKLFTDKLTSDATAQAILSIFTQETGNSHRDHA